MSRSVSIVVTILVFCGISRWAAGDEEEDLAPSALKPMNGIAWSEMTVRIVDPEGNPVAGARVRPWALRAGNGHGGWPEQAYGPPPRTTTDVRGQTVVVFPQSVQRLVAEKVVQVSLFVAHSDFCTASSHVDVPEPRVGKIPEIALKRGVRLRIAGVARGSDAPLSNCHVLLENGSTDEREFSPDHDGWMQSIPVSEDRRWFRVVRTPPGGLPEFSKPQAWTPDDPATREVRVELHPGIRVAGKISDDVPRPITRGHVVAWCGSPIRHKGDDQNRISPIWWLETASIQADGTFEFPSLPSGYLAQFYGMANDWISSQPTDEAYKTSCTWFGADSRPRTPSFRYAQILRLGGSSSQFTLEMERAGQVRVKCVDPAGNPLSQVHVSSWPNQYMVGGGSTIFCSRRSSLDGLIGKRDPGWKFDNPFSGETDEKGEVLIQNLPTGQQSFFAGNRTWMVNKEERVNVVLDKIVEKRVTLRRLP